MRKRVTMSDVAELVGVHVSTVSRALDPAASHRISPDVAAKIKRVAKKLGFHPNAAGHSLRTNRSRLIGIVVPDITDPVFPLIIRGLEDALNQRGYASILANTDGDEAKEAAAVDTLLARSVDGLVLASVRWEDKLLKRLEGFPVVTVVRETEDPSVPCVIYDEDSGMRQALDHLVGLGHRRIAAIAGPQAVSTGRSRWLAFDRRRRELKLPTDRRLATFAEKLTEAEGCRCAEQLLAKGGDFTAIMCANDRLAVGALEALARHGLACPQDISVVGFNDMPYADRFVPPLTTVRVQKYRAGVEAAKLMIEVIEAGDDPDRAGVRTVLPVELVVRASTQPVAVRAAAE